MWGIMFPHAMTSLQRGQWTCPDPFVLSLNSTPLPNLPRQEVELLEFSSHMYLFSFFYVFFFSDCCTSEMPEKENKGWSLIVLSNVSWGYKRESWQELEDLLRQERGRTESWQELVDLVEVGSIPRQERGFGSLTSISCFLSICTSLSNKRP